MKQITDSEIIFLLDVIKETIETDNVPAELGDECVPMLEALLDSENIMVA